VKIENHTFNFHKSIVRRQIKPTTPIYCFSPTVPAYYNIYCQVVREPGLL
jgi:hypothetical protein